MYLVIALFPGLLTPAFVACGTASDKRWGKKAWERGYLVTLAAVQSLPNRPPVLMNDIINEHNVSIRPSEFERPDYIGTPRGILFAVIVHAQSVD